MSILPEEYIDIKMPEMVKVRQRFDDLQITDHLQVIKEEFIKKNVSSIIKDNEKVLLLVGSRGIYKLDKMVKAIGDEIKALGATPYIMPAMGSHGGGTIEGQIKVLRDYNITQDSMGIEIICSNETCVIGETSCGTKIKICKEALLFDHVIPIARVKPHTDFRGPIESGICKMLAIGLGKHEGCYTIHKQGFNAFPRLIPEAAEIIINKCNVSFGFAIVENAYDKTYHLEIVKKENILTREPELLKVAKDKLGCILFTDIDVLVVEYTGKDISGAGMDPNIIGRTTQGILNGYNGPTYKNLVVLDLTKKSHGNACGIGVADFTTKKLFNKIDYQITYTNAIASSNINCARIPIVCDNEKEAIIAACLSCGDKKIKDIKIVRIADTLHLEDMQVSKNLLDYVKRSNNLSIVKDA